MYMLCYFWLRMSRPEGSILSFFSFEEKIPPWHQHYTREYAIKFILTMTNVVLIVLAVLKLLNFMRQFEDFGLFILLLSKCMSDIILFF